MTSDATSSTRSPLREAMRTGGRELSGYWGWFLILGVLWTGFGMYVLSYRVGSLAAVAALVGVAFLFGGIPQLAVSYPAAPRGRVAERGLRARGGEGVSARGHAGMMGHACRARTWTERCWPPSRRS